MIAIGRGQLQHHFWGTYCATIVLQFDDATTAARVVEDDRFCSWHLHTKHRNTIAFHGSDPELAQAIAVLVACGADRRKVESVAHSIDFGDPFTVAIELDV